MQNSRESFPQGGGSPPGPPIPFNVQAEIRKLKTDLTALSKTVKQIGGTMTKRREQIAFSRTLAIGGLAGSGARIEELSVLTGFVKEVTIHWPPGCNAFVDVVVGYQNTQFCPRAGFLALDSATPTYYFNEPITKDRPIWVIMQNRDGGFPHNITVTVIVEEV